MSWCPAVRKQTNIQRNLNSNIAEKQTDSAPLGGGGWNVGKTANPNIQGELVWGEM